LFQERNVKYFYRSDIEYISPVYPEMGSYSWRRYFYRYYYFFI